MVWIEHGDTGNYISLSEGYWPEPTQTMAQIEQLVGNSVSYQTLAVQTLAAVPAAEQAAAALNIATRVYTANLRYRRAELPLTTYVIGADPASQGVLTPWFASVHEPQPDHRYRLMIHMHPRIQEGPLAGTRIWSKAYKIMGIHHRPIHLPWVDIKNQTVPHLHAVLEASRRGPAAIEDAIRSLGHPYGHHVDVIAGH